MQKLAEDYADKTFRSDRVITPSGAMEIERLFLTLGDGVFTFYESPTIRVYAPTPEAAAAGAQEFRKYVKPPGEGKAHFYVISNCPDGASAESVQVKRSAPVSTQELALHYGDDFPAWEAEWIARMRGTPSGLTIMHGPPGCGKTSYLRALMSRMHDKAVFYFVPLSEAEMLSNSRFVKFWIRETSCHEKLQKVAILEDAEELLLARDPGSRDRVSNLLNIADGFLGDHLKLQVIATTNAPISKLDPAIVRPGRLIGMREFRRLNPVEARRLAEAKGMVLPVQRDFSLAELYCTPDQTAPAYQDKCIGFS
jgi:hypothetical protein